ncbi:poly(ADP-ribose) polymerase 16 [Arctopsyche grandis]|uniref:poly(ADP-ribose) polymerase 16 n=1 Tax=Arctopsyche grandis TaxID=121162 RepID=UPI00406D7934
MEGVRERATALRGALGITTSGISGTALRTADLRCSLFVAALLTYRRPTCLKPFPPFHVCNGIKQYEKLLDIIKRIPPLHIFVENLNDSTYIDNNEDIIDLLHYVLLDIAEPSLVPISNDLIDSILKKVPSEAEVCRPQYVFEVVHSSNSPNETKWLKLLSQCKTFYAYHGSKLENYHSILHHGLQQHMNKTKLYGSGTYLSSELSVSLPYSPGAFGWENSCLGRYLSCVALCELIDSPNGLVSQNSASNGAKNNPNHSKAKASDSMAGEIPHKYYIVFNNDLIRVRYLLVYARETPLSKTLYSSHIQKGFFRKWISQYKFLSMMLMYLVILIAIGLSNNNLLKYYYKRLCKKLATIFN